MRMADTYTQIYVHILQRCRFLRGSSSFAGTKQEEIACVSNKRVCSPLCSGKITTFLFKRV
jgi:hypothetical protein